MEIRQYVRGLLSRLWIVVLVTLIAGGVAYAAVRDTKDTYAGTVNVTVPAAQALTAGANGQYIANFQAGISSNSVLAKVSADTGESTDALAAGLSTNQLGNSSFISVTYVSTDAAKSEAVAKSAAIRTSELLAEPAIAQQQAIQASAQKALTDASAAAKTAQDALDAFTKKNGRVDSDLQQAQSALTQLTVSKQQQISSGRGTTNYDPLIAAAQAEVSRLQPLVSQYDALDRAASTAGVAAEGARARVVSATGDLAIASAPPLIEDPTHVLQPKKTVIVKTVAVAAGLAFVLGFGLILLVEFLVATRRSAPPVSKEASTSSRAPLAPMVPYVD
jgi:uncharacterized protein involved in exopolysaccharide biosynthesis